MVINVTAASDIPDSLVASLLKESDAIWREAGFHFVWRRGGVNAPANLRVLIGGGLLAEGERSGPLRLTRLAWIGVDARGVPEPQIYVSHASAVEYLRASGATVGALNVMPTLQREMYLARALGRALAHEVGHYLMGSGAHAATGLMKAVHSSTEFFGAERRQFRIAQPERLRMAARVTSIYMTALS